MRAHHLVLVLTLILVSAAFLADSAAAGPFKALAIKGGAYNGTQDYDFEGAQLFDPNGVWTGTLAVSTEWKFGRKSKIHFLLEAQYIQKDIEQTLLSPETGVDEDVTAGMTYLSVPLLAKLRTADTASSLYFLLGLSLDFVMERDELPSYPTLNQVFQDFSSTQYSVIIGLGIEHELGSQFDGVLEFRYTQNIANIYGGDDLGEDVRLNGVRQRGIMFLAGARYRFGRM